MHKKAKENFVAKITQLSKMVGQRGDASHTTQKLKYKIKTEDIYGDAMREFKISTKANWVRYHSRRD